MAVLPPILQKILLERYLAEAMPVLVKKKEPEESVSGYGTPDVQRGQFPLKPEFPLTAPETPSQVSRFLGQPSSLFKQVSRETPPSPPSEPLSEPSPEKPFPTGPSEKPVTSVVSDKSSIERGREIAARLAAKREPGSSGGGKRKVPISPSELSDIRGKGPGSPEPPKDVLYKFPDIPQWQPIPSNYELRPEVMDLRIDPFVTKPQPEIVSQIHQRSPYAFAKSIPLHLLASFPGMHYGSKMGSGIADVLNLPHYEKNKPWYIPSARTGTEWAGGAIAADITTPYIATAIPTATRLIAQGVRWGPAIGAGLRAAAAVPPVGKLGLAVAAIPLVAYGAWKGANELADYIETKDMTPEELRTREELKQFEERYEERKMKEDERKSAIENIKRFAKSSAKKPYESSIQRYPSPANIPSKP